jgi:hypothetical protein
VHRIPKKPFWHRTSVRLVALVAAALAVFGTAAEIAFAYWTTTGTAGGTATTGTLNPATGVSGTQTPGTGTVTVSWTKPASGVAPAGYYVTRTSGTTVAACGTSAAAPTTSTSCADTSVPLGSYTYTVVAVYRTWTATSAPSSAVTVAQAAQTITFTSTAPSNAVVNGASYTVTATGGGSGNPVVFSSATPGICTVTSSTVSFQHAGTCTVNANQAGSTYYSAAPTAQQSFSVGKATQTLTFTSTAPSNATVGGPSYTATATGGASGNPVVLSIDAVSSSVCSIAGSTVTFQHAGTCVIDANQAGNADYLAANQLQQSVAVGKGSQAVTFTSTAPTSAQVGVGSYTPTATATSGLAVTITLDGNSTGCALSSGTVTFTAAGTCVIDANQAGNADYVAAAQVQQSFVISRQNQTITFTSTAPSTAKVGGSTYTATATASSGLTVSFGTSTPSICTSSGTNGATISFVGAGSCVVTANQAGNGTYNAAPQATQSFTVAKGDQTITFTSTQPSNATVGGPTYTPTATASSGLTVAISLDGTSTGCTLNSGVVSFTAVGTCKIDANQTGNGNWNAATQVQQSFAVGKGSQTITFTSTAPNNAVAGGATYTATATASSGLTVTFSSGSTSICTSGGTNGATFTFISAGTCVVNANQAGDANYNAAPQLQQSVSVAPGVTAITLANGGAAAGTAESGDTLTIQYSNLMRASTFCSTWTNSGIQSVNGNNQVTVTITNNGANDTLTVSSGSGCTLVFGSVALGADYVSSTETFNGGGSNKSVFSLNTATGVLTITLGTGSGGSRTNVAVSTPSYTPAAGLTDTSGNAIGAGPFTATSTSRF